MGRLFLIIRILHLFNSQSCTHLIILIFFLHSYRFYSKISCGEISDGGCLYKFYFYLPLELRFKLRYEAFVKCIIIHVLDYQCLEYITQATVNACGSLFTFFVCFIWRILVVVQLSHAAYFLLLVIRITLIVLYLKSQILLWLIIQHKHLCA